MIKKEYLNGRVVVYNADCLEVMKKIEDRQIDLVLTDPPYGIGYDKLASKQSGTQHGRAAARKNTFHGTDWDNAPPQEVFDEIFRISKNQIIWGGEHLCLNFPQSRGWLVWDKNTWGNNFSDCELAWTSFKKPVRKFTFTWNGMLQGDMQNKEVRIHPTQKSSRLFQWCLLNNSNENDLIFDGFLGSGTTAIACINTNRRLIGCELDPIYFEKMCERIETTLAQEDFFRVSA